MKIHCSNILSRSIYHSSLFLKADKPRTDIQQLDTDYQDTTPRFSMSRVGRGINWPSLDLILIFHPVPVVACNNHRFSPHIEMQRVM